MAFKKKSCYLKKKKKITLIEQIMFLFTGTADSKITVGASLSHGLQSGVFFFFVFYSQ